MRRTALLLSFSRGVRGGEPVLALAPGWVPDLLDAKRVVFVRHAEGKHNADARVIPNYFTDNLGHGMDYWDADLTSEGRAQCERLRQRLPDQVASEAGGCDNAGDCPGIDLVAVSPLTRTLRTASLAFQDADGGQRRPPFVATSLARERISLHTCDGRRPRSELQREFPWVDFVEVESEEDEMWAQKEFEAPTPWGPDGAMLNHSASCAARGVQLLRWLHARPEQSIAVVSHWVFLLHLFRPFAAEHPALAARFGNAEARTATLFRVRDGGRVLDEL